MNRYRPATAVLVAALTTGGADGQESIAMRKLSPVIFVEAVEPCLAFWVDRLGFERTIQVPTGDRLGFAAVQAGRVEIMYQSRESIAADIPHLAAGDFARSGYVLFIEVDDLERADAEARRSGGGRTGAADVLRCTGDLCSRSVR